ncbi:hypothetical protein [Clostridium sp. Cult1]|uniref:hypothetical protein n=1 Tax=Clostridium sp. Cult1 TaxID=2079002 RepID=UPI001F26F0AA|nr:hypothetical protein [Clostridium sp. Cult1]MCF6462012.1 hypothetical protein [Clostridium sp. Cult1]
MKKLSFNQILSFIIIALLVLPAFVFASSGTNVNIKNVYFKDENGNMVFVDYEEAISNSMEGDHTLYDAIRHYVGTAEEKGWTLYLETNSGIILDFRLAMIDNLFKLRDIINNEKYKVDGQIEYTHELKVVDGVARIVEIEDEDPGDPDDPYIISITSVPNIEVDIGTSEEEAISKLRKTTTIKDSEGDTHIVSLDWSIRNYDKDLEGEYIAIGVFELPEGIKNRLGLELKVETTVKVIVPVVKDWPVEVENVFVGESDITSNTYVNIEIKEEYVAKVITVYVDNVPTNKIEGAQSQWRVRVEDGTTIEDLKGRISVTLDEEDVEEPQIIATFRPSFIPTFGYVSIEVNNIENAEKFDVVYHLSDSEDGTENIMETDIVPIGEESGMIFYNINQYDTVDIRIYDGNDVFIYIFEDVVLNH